MLTFDFNTYTKKCVSKTKKLGKNIGATVVKNRLVVGKYSYFNNISEFVTKPQLMEIISLSEYIKRSCDVFLVICTGCSYNIYQSACLHYFLYLLMLYLSQELLWNLILPLILLNILWKASIVMMR